MLADENLKVKLHVGYPSTPNKLQLKYEIKQNPHGTWQEIAHKLGVSHKTILSHLHKHRMTLKLSKWLTPCSICRNMFWLVEHLLVILDTPQQSLILELNIDMLRKKVNVWYQKKKHHWLTSRSISLSAKLNINQKKIMLYVWWTRDTIVHYEFSVSGKTITVDVYSLQVSSAMLQN